MLKPLNCLAFLLAGLAACKDPAPPPKGAPPEPAPARPAPAKKTFPGTRLGPVIAQLYIVDSILVSGPRMREGPPVRPPAGSSLPGPGPVPIPVQDKAWITVTLSNDGDSALTDLGLEGDWLFRVEVADSSGAIVFRATQPAMGFAGLAPGESRRFEVVWPVKGRPLGSYVVSVRFGFGGKLTARTRLY